MLYRFDDYALDTDRRELLRARSPIAVPWTTLGHKELGPRRAFDEERADLGPSAA
jgi:hypothetical protein